MLREKLRHGFPEADWNAAKEEARAVMIERAKVRGGTIAYSDLVKNIASIKIEARDTRLFHMLGEISTEEDALGRGMPTVVVVHKHDMQPGPGFFELAQSLGRNTKDKLKCWAAEPRQSSCRLVEDNWDC